MRAVAHLLRTVADRIDPPRRTAVWITKSTVPATLTYSHTGGK